MFIWLDHLFLILEIRFCNLFVGFFLSDYEMLNSQLYGQLSKQQALNVLTATTIGHFLHGLDFAKVYMA